VKVWVSWPRPFIQVIPYGKLKVLVEKETPSRVIIVMRMQLLKTDSTATTVTDTAVVVEQVRPDEHPVAVYLASLAPGSRRTMKQALRVIVSVVAPGATVDAFPWSSLAFQHVSAIRSRLAESYSPTNANKMLAALRGVLRASFFLGQMKAEKFTSAIAVKSIRGVRVVRGRAVSQDELRAMFSVCSSSTPSGARDAALLAVTYGAGLRRDEVVQLDIANFDRRTGTLTVNGKGNKERTAYVTNGSRSALESWLALRGEIEGPLFVPVNKANRVCVRRMTDQAVYMIFKRLASKAKVERFCPHDLRRTFIGDLLDRGADIVTVQALAGHASVNTTSRYDRRGERTRRRAAEMLHVPFEG
jgi:site-specific recombinase XerD